MIQQAMVTSAIRIAARYVPSLATKIGGEKAEEIAREVVEAAIARAGLGRDASTAEVLTALDGAPARADELRRRLEEIDLRWHEADVRDRISARAWQLDSGDDAARRRNLILIGVVGGLLFCIGVVAWPRTAEQQLDAAILGLITTIAGALLKMFSDAFAFEFGSSRGSKNKDAQITAFTEKLKEVGEANARIAREAVARGQSAPQEKSIQDTAPDPVTAGNAAVAIDADGAPHGTAAVAGRATAPRRHEEPRRFVHALVEGELRLA